MWDLSLSLSESNSSLTRWVFPAHQRRFSVAMAMHGFDRWTCHLSLSLHSLSLSFKVIKWQLHLKGSALTGRRLVPSWLLVWDESHLFHLWDCCISGSVTTAHLHMGNQHRHRLWRQSQIGRHTGIFKKPTTYFLKHFVFAVKLWKMSFHHTQSMARSMWTLKQHVHMCLVNAGRSSEGCSVASSTLDSVKHITGGIL